MKHLILRSVAIAWIVCLSSCSLFTRQNAKTALDVVDAACILTHGELFNSKEVAEACGIAETLIPELEKLLEARRMAAIKKAQAHGICP